MLNRILIVAENASTRLGGEAILPYHYYRLLRAQGQDVHLIVHERMRDELEVHFPADANLHFVADQLLQKLFYKAGRILPRRIDESTLGLANQLLTQVAQRAVVRKLLIPGTVIHQPIPVSPRAPSVMAGLAPLVCGPLNGGMEYPIAFRGAESAITRALITLGRTLTDAMNAVFSGKRNAALVLVANARTRAALPSGLKGRVVELVENGVDAGQWTSTGAAPPAAARFIFIGRLIDWKALDIALDALAAVPGVSLDVIGDGPMRAAWQAHPAARKGLAKFHGWKSQAECAELLRGATALLLPSVYECGGAVVLEAMAAAVPVIATAWGGPLDYLDPTCGFLIPPDSREALVNGFAQAMNTLVADPALRSEMGAAGRTRVLAHFTWEQKNRRPSWPSPTPFSKKPLPHFWFNFSAYPSWI